MIFSSLQMQSGLMQTKVYYIFLTLGKEATHKTSHVAAVCMFLVTSLMNSFHFA